MRLSYYTHLGLDDDVAVEDLGGHHLGLGGGLDERLPRVGRVGDDEAELEVPLLNALLLEHDALLQPELLHGLGRAEVDLAGDGAALEDALRDPAEFFNDVSRRGHPGNEEDFLAPN